MTLLNDLYIWCLSYIQIGINKHHIWSFIVYGIFALMVLNKVYRRTKQPVYSTVMTLMMMGVANSFYEMYWQYLTWASPTNMVLSVTSFTGITVALAVYNRTEVKWNSKALLIYAVMMATFTMMYIRGDYEAIRQWYLTKYTTIDPHDWLWMINKTAGAFVLYPLVKGEKDD